MAIVQAIFRIRRDTAANWTAANPVLKLGEPGLETDTRRVKYGDGTTAWNALAYSSAAATWTDITGVPANLTALGSLASNGLIARTGSGTVAARSLVAPAAGLTITNPDGVAGNPTFALANDLAALEALSGTGIIPYRSAVDTWAAVTVSANLGFSAGTLGSALGTAATRNTGTSGATVPLLNATNTWSLKQVIGSSVLGQLIDLYAANAGYGFGIQGGVLYSRAGTSFSLFVGGTHSDTANDPGAGGTEAARFTTTRAIFPGSVKTGSFTVATVPSASTAGAGALIFVSNESGGAVTAFSDGTNWRRVTDRAVIS